LEAVDRKTEEGKSENSSPILVGGQKSTAGTVVTGHRTNEMGERQKKFSDQGTEVGVLWGYKSHVKWGNQCVLNSLFGGGGP